MQFDWLLLLGTGILAGALGSLAGLGGGIVLVPSLLFFGETLADFSHFSPSMTAGTALLITMFTGLASTISYTRQRRVDFRSGGLFFVGSGPGAWAGAYFNQYLNVDTFYILFGCLIVTMSFLLRKRRNPGQKRMTWKVQRSYTDQAGTEYQYGYHPLHAVAISFAIGMIAGMFGIGGGSLFVPLMILLFHFPPHLATATSMFVILLSAATGSITHIYLGHIDWWAVLWLAPGALIGANIGAWLSSKISGPYLVHVLQIVFVIIGLRMIVDGIW